MKQALPGYYEITCPFCSRYRHVPKDEIEKLQDRRLGGKREIICDSCWAIHRKLNKMKRRKKKRGNDAHCQ